MFLLMGQSTCRGHSFSITGCLIMMVQNFFPLMVVNLWISFPQWSAEAKSLNILKAEINWLLYCEGVEDCRVQVEKWIWGQDQMSFDQLNDRSGRRDICVGPAAFLQFFEAQQPWSRNFPCAGKAKSWLGSKAKDVNESTFMQLQA